MKHIKETLPEFIRYSEGVLFVYLVRVSVNYGTYHNFDFNLCGTGYEDG